MHETQFYIKTWMLWIGCLYFGFSTCFLGVLVPLTYFGIVKTVGGMSGLPIAIPLLITFFVALWLFVVCAFHLVSRRRKSKTQDQKQASSE